MLNIARNDPCPCGSGKKFKKCHMGREDELLQQQLQPLPTDTAQKIADLPDVEYGRCRQLLTGLNLEKLSGLKVGIRFVDLKSYLDLGLGVPEAQKEVQLAGISAGRMINPIKTLPADKANIYIAVSPDVSDSTLVHQLAHVLDYLAGSRANPALAAALGMELDMPTELLEHPKEFGYWLTFLANEFGVDLDAEDEIVAFLYEKGYLLPGQTLATDDMPLIEASVKRTMDFLRNNRRELDERIKGRQGYLNETAPK
jgi:hypothetical protein